MSEEKQEQDKDSTAIHYVEIAENEDFPEWIMRQYFHMSTNFPYSSPIVAVTGIYDEKKTMAVVNCLDKIEALYVYIDCTLAEIPASSWGGHGPLVDVVLNPIIYYFAKKLEAYLEADEEFVSYDFKSKCVRSFLSMLEILKQMFELWVKISENRSLPRKTPILVLDNACSLAIQYNDDLQKILCLGKLIRPAGVFPKETLLPTLITVLIHHRPLAVNCNTFYSIYRILPYTSNFSDIEKMLMLSVDTKAIPVFIYMCKKRQRATEQKFEVQYEENSQVRNILLHSSSQNFISIHWQSLKSATINIDDSNRQLKIDYLVIKELWSLFSLIIKKSITLEPSSDYNEFMLITQRLWALFILPIIMLKQVIIDILITNEFKRIKDELRLLFERNPLFKPYINSAFSHHLKMLPVTQSPLPHIFPEIPIVKPQHLNFSLYAPPTYICCAPSSMCCFVAAFLCSYANPKTCQLLLLERSRPHKSSRNVIYQPKPFYLRQWVLMVKYLFRSIGSDEAESLNLINEMTSLMQTPYIKIMPTDHLTSKCLHGTLRLICLVSTKMIEDMARRMELPLSDYLDRLES